MKIYSSPIAAYRKFAGFRQVDLAKATNLSAATIISYETGLRNPTLKNLQKILNALNQKGFPNQQTIRLSDLL